MAKLTILEGPDAGRKVEFDSGTVTLGRTDEADITIPHASISRRHASLTYQAGAWQLEDLGSQNGVFVNGQRISSPVLLRQDTDFVLGNI